MMLSDVLTSVAYIGPKSRTERPRKTKFGIEVAHVTCDWDTTFKVKRSKVKVKLSLLFVILHVGITFVVKKVLFTHKLWPTPLPTNIVTPNPLHVTSLPAPMYIYAYCLFRLLFLSIISTAYHLLSGSRAARLLLS